MHEPNHALELGMTKYHGRRIDLPDGKWFYAHKEAMTHGQHYIGYGSCGYINFHLYDQLILDLYWKKKNGIRTAD